VKLDSKLKQKKVVKWMMFDNLDETQKHISPIFNHKYGGQFAICIISFTTIDNRNFLLFTGLCYYLSNI
jgi:hypothetical protein